MKSVTSIDDLFSRFCIETEVVPIDAISDDTKVIQFSTLGDLSCYPLRVGSPVKLDPQRVLLCGDAHAILSEKYAALRNELFGTAT